MAQNLLPVQQLYDIKNRNYEWQSFQYQIPRYYLPSAAQPHLKTTAPPKQNYIDELQRVTRGIPAPNAYSLPVAPRPLSGQMSGCARTTLAESIIRRSVKENTPSPSSYAVHRPHTAYHVQRPNPAAQREHYLNEVEYHAVEKPGVGQYNISQAGRHIQGPVIKNSRVPKTVAAHKHNPPQYAIVQHTFEWIGRQKKKGNSRMFGSSKRFEIAKENKPAPNAYHFHQEWNENNTFKRITTKNCNLNVYYH